MILDNEETKAVANYNLSGVLALMGKVPDALRHLETAIRLNAGFKEAALTDSDFASIREQEGFQRLVRS
jgi:hypothetical protein